MKIKKLNLISYGKFKNHEMNFSDGLNIVSGQNGSGKSTTLAFIRAMLYGFSGRGAVSQNDRKHYLPWNGDVLSGSMDIKTDDGKEIKISRTSGKSQGFDKMSCLNTLNGDDIAFSPEEVLSCGEDAFLKTLCIKQMQSTFSGEDSEISKKLINLTHSACEDIDTEKTVEIITDYMKTFKALRGDKGKISDIEKSIAALNERIYVAGEKRLSSFALANKQKELQIQKETYSKELVEISSKIESAKNAELFTRLDSLLKEAEEIKKNIENKKAEEAMCNEILLSLSSYENEAPAEMFSPPIETSLVQKEINETKNKIKSTNISAAVLSVLTVLFAVAGFFVPVVFVLSATMLGGVLISLVNKSKLSKKLTQSEKELENITANNGEISKLLSQYGVNDIREYAVKSAEYSKAKAEKENIFASLTDLYKKESKLSEEIALYREKCENLTRSDVSENYDDLYKRQAFLNGEIQRLISESAHIDGVLSAEINPDEAPEILQAQLKALIAKRDEAIKELEASTLALDTVNEVFSEMRSDFTPLVNEKASEYLKMLTEGDIDKIYIDKKFAVTAEKEGAKELSYFSLGTADQTYFAIRLAICDLLFGKEKPLFIDDAFLQYDSEREKKAFELLKKKAEEGQQIIFFTCKPYPNIEGANIINL